MKWNKKKKHKPISRKQISSFIWEILKKKNNNNKK